MARALHQAGRVARRRKRGFTLIEMMIVVVIVGVLASLAVVGYRQLVQTSHVTEGVNNVQAIRVAQEAFHAETQQYADISTDLTSSWYPQTSPARSKVTAWGGACSTCGTTTWAMLPLHIDGPVMFGYATKAGTTGTQPPSIAWATGVTLPSSPTTEWFVIGAMCDIDGNGSPNTYVLTTSWSNQVFTFNEGQ